VATIIWCNHHTPANPTIWVEVAFTMPSEGFHDTSEPASSIDSLVSVSRRAVNSTAEHSKLCASALGTIWEIHRPAVTTNVWCNHNRPANLVSMSGHQRLARPKTHQVTRSVSAPAIFIHRTRMHRCGSWHLDTIDRGLVATNRAWFHYHAPPTVIARTTFAVLGAGPTPRLETLSQHTFP